MSEYDQIFAGIETSKPINNFASRLGVGRHRVVMTRYAVKESQKGLGKIIEADFQILESSKEPVGETRGWAWFPNQGGLPGQYAQARAKEFIEVVKASIGDQNPVGAVGGALASKEQHGRGLVLDVEIQIPTNPDGSPKLSKAGSPVSNAFWSPVTQTLGDIAAMRAKLDAGVAQAAAEEKAAAASAPAASAPTTGLGGSSTTTSAPATGLGGGFLAGFKKP